MAQPLYGVDGNLLVEDLPILARSLRRSSMAGSSPLLGPADAADAPLHDVLSAAGGRASEASSSQDLPGAPRGAAPSAFLAAQRTTRARARGGSVEDRRGGLGPWASAAFPANINPATHTLPPTWRRCATTTPPHPAARSTRSARYPVDWDPRRGPNHSYPRPRPTNRSVVLPTSPFEKIAEGDDGKGPETPRRMRLAGAEISFSSDRV